MSRHHLSMPRFQPLVALISPSISFGLRFSLIVCLVIVNAVRPCGCDYQTLTTNGWLAIKFTLIAASNLLLPHIGVLAEVLIR